MPANYNTEPYFDDFDTNKNFMRVLFRPGRAVQARELTQAQTILQNQISSMASSIFKENSRVLGAELSVKATKVTLVVNPSDSNSVAVDVNALLGFRIQDRNTNSTQATITNVDAANNRVLLDIHGGVFAIGGQFETIDPISGLGNSGTNFTIDSIHNSLIAHINDGIVYVGGNFVTVKSENYVVDSTPTMATKEFAIGYIVNEASTDSLADISLVDNATGSYNYNAPGADRISKIVSLSSYEVIRDGSGVETSVAPNFLNKIIIVKNAVAVTDLIQNIKYADIIDLLARRTSAESGNYTTEPYQTNLVESTNQANIALHIGRGASFVEGYELVNQFTRTIEIPKSRDFATATNQQYYFNAGAYYDLTSFTGIFDVSAEETITLYQGINGTGTVIGTARVLSVGLNQYGELRLYIQQYESFISAFNSVGSIVGNSSAAIGVIKNDVITGTPVYAINSKTDAIVDVYGNSKLNNIKSIPSTSVSYDIIKTYLSVPETTPGSLAFTLTAPNTTTDFYVANGVYAVIDTTTNAVLSDPADYSVSAVTNQNGGVSTMTITTIAAHTNISVIVPMYKSQSSSRLKTLHKAIQETIAADANGLVTLTNYDILNFVSVEDMTNPASPVVVDPTTYTTNNGQTDWVYNFGTVSGLTAATDYRITVDHFSHSTSGDYFSVDSYMSLPANVDSVTGFVDLYSRIGNYTTSNGNTYKLINCFDTRQTPTNLTSSDKVRAASQNLQLNYDYYIGRIDKLYLNRSGAFGSVHGIASSTPQEPTSPLGTMELGVLYVPPYTHTAEDCALVVYSNKRYTMPDIGKLDLRLKNLEDYVSFGLLEKTAQSMNIVDANGLNRYKNGIFVDNFMSHENGNTTDAGYNTTIDDIYGGLVPNQQENFNALTPSLVGRINIQEQRNLIIPALSADTVTLSFTEVEFLAQKANTNSINVNPYAAVVWHGTATLNPNSDIWVDTSYLPTISNTSGSVSSGSSRSTANTSVKDQYTLEYNPYAHRKDPAVQASIAAQIKSRSSAGIPHGDTRAQASANFAPAFNGEKQATGWVGFLYERDRTTTTTTTTTRVVPTTSTSSVDNFVSSSMIPMMRSKAISYYLSGMRPNQFLHATFDGVDVDAHVTNLQADQYGSVSGVFTIPVNTFSVGAKDIKFFDAEATTDAKASFYAQGTLNTRQITTTTIHSSYTVTTTASAASSVESHATVYLDPIAQSFLPIPDNNASGVFLSSVDLFFKTKATDLPVSIFIVPTQTGVPTQNRIPGSDVTKLPTEVLVSANGFTATNFKFESPIFLEANVEYAIVIVSNSNNYTVWYAKQGEPTLLNQNGQTETNRSGLAISKQPYLGVMFKSQNSATWTEDQTADLKFIFYRCEFDTTAGTIYFDTEDLVANGNEGMAVARFQPNIHSMAVGGTHVSYEYSLDNGTTWAPYQDLSKIFVSETILSTVGGNKPFSVRASMTTDNSWVSPMIDLNRAGYATSINLFPTNNEGGTYISKTVQLANPALDLRVLVDLLEPAGSAVEVFFSTQTPQVPMFTTNTTSIYKTGVTSSLVGVDAFMYHRNAAGGALTKVGGFIPSRIDAVSTFASNISNVDMFVAPASSTTYANVDKVFFTTISNLTSVPDWVAGNHSIGSYVFYNNSLWKARATTTAAPVVNSVDWEEIPHMSIETTLTTDTAIHWRPMVKEIALGAGVDPSANFFTYTMLPDSVIEEPFDKFAIKIVLTSTNNAITPRAQNLRAVAAT